MKHNIIKGLCKLHILSALCGTLILIVCVIKIPAQDEPVNIPYFDKIVHFLMYFVFSVIYISEKFSASNNCRRRPLPTYIIAFVLSLVIGGMIELIQAYMTNYRSGEFLDWFSDIAGCLSAIVITEFVRLAFLKRGR